MSEDNCNSCVYFNTTLKCKLGLHNEQSFQNLWDGLYFPFGYPSLAPFVPTPCRVIQAMLSLAELKSGEVVYDLGSGDGRIVMLASGVFGAEAIGFEQEDELVKKSINKINELQISDKAKIVKDNLLKADISKADVIIMYLSPAGNQEVKPKLESELKPGARVVSLEFEIQGWQSQKVIQIVNNSLTYTIYLYVE